MVSTPIASTPAPVAAPGAPRERRLRFGHLSAAVTLIVVGALGTAALVTAASADGTYLAVAEDVPYGTMITADHLTTVRIANPPELNPVDVAELDRIVGYYAAMPLAAGTLLAPAHVAERPIPGPDQHVVGITLSGERLPAQRPAPGDSILLVATPERGERPEQGPTWEATVTRIVGHGGGLLDSGGRTVTLDVAIPARQGPEVARLAAANRIVVILNGEQ